jgi:CoA binding domain
LADTEFYEHEIGCISVGLAKNNMLNCTAEQLKHIIKWFAFWLIRLLHYFLFFHIGLLWRGCSIFKHCEVAKYLIEHGYNVIPVNPTLGEVLGRKAYPTIAHIEGKVDIVDVFRKSEDVPAVRKSEKNGIKVLWIQIGILMKIHREKQKKMA